MYFLKKSYTINRQTREHEVSENQIFDQTCVGSITQLTDRYNVQNTLTIKERKDRTWHCCLQGESESVKETEIEIVRAPTSNFQFCFVFFFTFQEVKQTNN